MMLRKTYVLDVIALFIFFSCIFSFDIFRLWIFFLSCFDLSMLRI